MTQEEVARVLDSSGVSQDGARNVVNGRFETGRLSMSSPQG